MSANHSDFDAQKLFDLKSHHLGYRFCPRCASSLTVREADGRARPVCTNGDCGFIFYQNPIPAAGVILVQDDEVLLVQRAHPPRIGDWCIPAGFMEWHEHPRDTAVRELKEETGLDVELADLFEIYTGTDDPRVNAVLVLYTGRILGGQMRADDDALAVRFFPFDDLPENIAFEAHTRALNDYTRRYRSAPKE